MSIQHADWILGIPKSNNLPLALDPISNVSNAHASYMTIMVLDAKQLRQRVCDVVCGGHSAHLHISSVDYVSDQMESSEYVFGSLMRSGFSSLCYSTVVIT